MELLLNTQQERCRMEVYNEYLKKIPQLLTQLEAVEKMYEKALMEEHSLRHLRFLTTSNLQKLIQIYT